MASYFVKYNNVNLTNMIRVRTVNSTVLPPRENNAITIWERPGGIYNSYRYGEREITITFLVMVSKQEYKNNPNSIDSKITAIGNVFKVDGPKPLYLGSSSKYIYAVPEGEFKMTELRYDCYECEIMFVCYDPQYYSSSTKSYSNKSSGDVSVFATNDNSQFDAYNAGSAPTYPIINIGINKDNTSFVQLENLTNGNKMLLGTYPSSDKSSPVHTTQMVLDDNMSSLTAWDGILSKYTDDDRGASGFLRETSDNDGMRLYSIGSKNHTWSGASAIKDLGTGLTDFSVQVRMNHNSTGVDGDPSKVALKDETELSNVMTGTKTEFYKVTAPSLEVRASTNDTAQILGTLEKGTNVEATPVSTNKSWVRFSYGATTGYCYTKYLRKYISDSTETYTERNVVTKEEVELRSAPTDDVTSLLLATIPAATPLRVNKILENGFYKLYISYNGIIGYVDATKVGNYSGAVEYPEDEVVITNDNKTGVCELYGWTADGTKLFKLSLIDDNEYYEYTKPAIQVGSNTVLEDNSSVPTPNKNDYSEQLTVTHDYLDSGSDINWNEFYGELGIQRQNGKWQAWIYKIKDGSTIKKLVFKEQEVVDAPEDDLAFITIYMGSRDGQNISGMSISDIKVKYLNTYDLSTQNVTRFNKGDKIKIDCHNNKVYLNDQLYYDVGVGSDFIEIIAGNNVMKVVSDDPDVIATVIFNERYL